MSNKYSPDLWIVARQLPSWMKEREGAGGSYVIQQPTPSKVMLRSIRKLNTLCTLPLNLQAGIKILGVDLEISSLYFSYPDLRLIFMFCIRPKLPVLPVTGNSHWSNPDAICHQMSITTHQKDIDAVSVSLERQILAGKWTMLTWMHLRAI